MKLNTRNVFLTAFIITAIVILPVLISNGGNFYLVGDYMSQQIPFIKEMKRVLFSGTPFWSSNTFLGANFIGTYSFYNLFSPFYWLLFLLPENHLGIGLGITLVLKLAIAASAAHIYLKKHTKYAHLAFIGALIYAFSGFTLDSTYYFHFIDVIAVFPLIPYLTDEVLEGRKKYLLSFAVLLNAMINYYFLVATSVFFLIYLFFRIRFSDKYSLKDGIRCVIFYAIGGFMSMFALLPSALSLLETNKATGSFLNSLVRGLGTFPQLIKTVKGIILPSEGVLGSACGFTFSSFNSNSCFLPFFGAVLCFISLKQKEKLWQYKLYKFLFVLTLVPFGNGLFSFFTNMSYTRWWYQFVLIGVLVSITVLEKGVEKSEIKKSAKTILILSSVVLGLPAILKIITAYIFPNILGFLPEGAVNYLTNAGLTEKFNMTDLKYLTVFLVMTFATYIPLYISFKNNLIFNAKKTVPLVVLVIAASCTAYLANEADIFSPDKNYRGNDMEISENVSYNYRTDFNNSFANYPQTVNAPGTGAFISFKSHATAKFCNLVGYDNTLHLNSVKHFDTEAIQAVLSVKYVYDKDGNRNISPYYTPFGFSYDKYILSDKFEYTTDENENNKRIEMMTSTVFVDSETAEKLNGKLQEIQAIENTDWKENIKKVGCDSFSLNSNGFTAKKTSESEELLFFSIPHDNGWTAFVNGNETEILTVNGGLMGIFVPEGENEIEFKFTTPGLKIGAIISIISLLGIFIYSIIEKKKKN